MPKDQICGMEVKEDSPLTLVHKGEKYYFCNPRCREKFAAENQIALDKIPACSDCRKTPFYKNKTLAVFFALVLLSLLAFVFPVLTAFRDTLWIYFKSVWWAVALGLILGGIIDYYVPREYISRTLAKPKKSTIFYSVLLGFLMSACSHGILALSMQLHKEGASNPAVIAFLLASPWANMTLTVMLLGFFKLKAFFIIGSAIVIALITGLIFQVLERKKLIETNQNTVLVQPGFSVISDIKKRIAEYRFSSAKIKKDLRGVCQGSLALSEMVLWWIMIGMGIASLAGAYIPEHIFSHYMGPTVLGLFVTLGLATVIEVCSEGSAPMAFEIYRQTQALGNSFVFLMAGVVTDYTEIGLIWHNVGKKTALWLLLVSVPQVIVLGLIANLIF